MKNLIALLSIILSVNYCTASILTDTTYVDSLSYDIDCDYVDTVDYKELIEIAYTSSTILVRSPLTADVCIYDGTGNLIYEDYDKYVFIINGLDPKKYYVHVLLNEFSTIKEVYVSTLPYD